MSAAQPLPNVTASSKKQSRFRFAVVAPLLAAVIIVSGYFSARTLEWWSNPRTAHVRGIPLTVSWAIIAAALVVFLALLGLELQRRIGGALIDDQNLMSLSRFQLVAWTVLIVSAFLAIALVRAFSSVPDALQIKVPPELWQLLGITAGAAVGKEVVHSVKKNKPVQNPDVAAVGAAEAINAQSTNASEKTNAAEVEANRVGLLYGNPSPADARFSDMFQGVEVGDTAYIDVSKVQMFFFTVAALVAYGADIYAILSGATAARALTALPVVGSGLLAILTISQATYLGNKAIDHTNGAASPAAQAQASLAMIEAVDDPLEQDA